MRVTHQTRFTPCVQKGTRFLIVWLQMTLLYLGTFGLHLDGASNPGTGKTDEGGGRASQRRDGTKTFSAAGWGATGQRGPGERFFYEMTSLLSVWERFLFGKLVSTFLLLIAWQKQWHKLSQVNNKQQGSEKNDVIMLSPKFLCQLLTSAAPIWGDGRPAGGESPDCWRGGQAVGTQGCRSWAGEAEIRGHCHEDQGGEKADGAKDEGGRTAGCQTRGAVRTEVWNHPD